MQVIRRRRILCPARTRLFTRPMYRDAGLKGGHVILLNAADSPYFQVTKEQAMKALKTYPGGLQLGGGVRPENAEEYLEGGASHVIVTSYVFRDGKISWENLEKMERTGRSGTSGAGFKLPDERRAVLYCH